MIQFTLRTMVGVTVIVACFFALLRLIGDGVIEGPFVFFLLIYILTVPFIVVSYGFHWPSLFLIFYGTFGAVVLDTIQNYLSNPLSHPDEFYYHLMSGLAPVFLVGYPIGLVGILMWCDDAISDTIDE